MLFLIANAMFVATGTPTLSAKPVRKPWIKTVASHCNKLGWKRPQASKAAARDS